MSVVTRWSVTEQLPVVGFGLPREISGLITDLLTTRRNLQIYGVTSCTVYFAQCRYSDQCSKNRRDFKQNLLYGDLGLGWCESR